MVRPVYAGLWIIHADFIIQKKKEVRNNIDML